MPAEHDPLLAQVNGDPAPDVIIGNRENRRNDLYINNGSGGFEATQDSTFPGVAVLLFEGADTLAPFLFDRMPLPAELLPAGSWVALTHTQRTLQREDLVTVGTIGEL